MSEESLDVWFMRVVLPHEAALERFLRRNWRDLSEIQDLRQETYARVYAAARKERPKSPKAFIFSTARNLVIDRVRKSRVVSIDTGLDLEALHVFIDEPLPDEQVSARQELRLLQAALDDLPPRCRDVVVLRKVYGLSQRDTAMQLGIAECTVEKHVSKGVRRLSEALFGASTNVRSPFEFRLKGEEMK